MYMLMVHLEIINVRCIWLQVMYTNHHDNFTFSFFKISFGICFHTYYSKRDGNFQRNSLEHTQSKVPKGSRVPKRNFRTSTKNIQPPQTSIITFYWIKTYSTCKYIPSEMNITGRLPEVGNLKLITRLLPEKTCAAI